MNKKRLYKWMFTVVMLVCAGMVLTSRTVSAQTLRDNLEKDIGPVAADIYKNDYRETLTQDEIEALVESMNQMIERIEHKMSAYDESGWITEDGQPFDPLNVYTYRSDLLTLRELQMTVSFMGQVYAFYEGSKEGSYHTFFDEYELYKELYDRYGDENNTTRYSYEEFSLTIVEWVKDIPKEQIYWDLVNSRDALMDKYIETVADSFEEQKELRVAWLELLGEDEDAIDYYLAEMEDFEKNRVAKYGNLGGESVYYYEVLKKDMPLDAIKNQYDEYYDSLERHYLQIYELIEIPDTSYYKQSVLLQYGMDMERAEFIRKEFGGELVKEFNEEAEYYEQHLEICVNRIYETPVLEITGSGREGMCRQ